MKLVAAILGIRIHDASLFFNHTSGEDAAGCSLESGFRVRERADKKLEKNF